jgi:hypothetical protein
MQRRRVVQLVALVLAVVGLGACAGRLRPAPEAQLAPPDGAPGAVAEASGVTLEARVGAWRAWPPNLEAVTLPVLVTIDNRGGLRLRVRYDDFDLTAQDGRRFAARAPFALTGYVAQPVTPYAYPYWGPGPMVFGGFRSAAFVGRPFFYDPFYYDYWPPVAYVGLPSGDMVQLALREAVVEPQTRVSGFVYFDRLPRKVTRVDLTFRLVDAASGEARGEIVIPFVVE